MIPNQKIDKINYNEQFKIRVRRNASIKHEHTKLEIVLNLLEKYKKNLYWIRIYTEYEISNTLGKKKIVDVYFENLKNNEIICYEIQKNISKKWLEETEDFYKRVDKIYFTIDWIVIKEKELSDNIKELKDKIKSLII